MDTTMDVRRLWSQSATISGLLLIVFYAAATAFIVLYWAYLHEKGQQVPTDLLMGFAMISAIKWILLLAYGSIFGKSAAPQFSVSVGQSALRLAIATLLLGLSLSSAIPAAEWMFLSFTQNQPAAYNELVAVPGLNGPTFTPSFQFSTALVILMAGVIPLALFVLLLNRFSMGVFSAKMVFSLVFANIVIGAIAILAMSSISSWTDLGGVSEHAEVYSFLAVCVHVVAMLLILKLYKTTKTDLIAGIVVFMALFAFSNVAKEQVYEKLENYTSEFMPYFLSAQSIHLCEDSTDRTGCWAVSTLKRIGTPVTEDTVHLLSGMNGQGHSFLRTMGAFKVARSDIESKTPMPELAEWLSRGYRNFLAFSLTEAGGVSSLSAEEISENKQQLKWAILAVNDPSAFLSEWAISNKNSDSYLMGIRGALTGEWAIDSRPYGEGYTSYGAGVLRFHFKEGEVYSEGSYTRAQLADVVRVQDQDLPSHTILFAAD